MCEIVNLLEDNALETDYVSECARIFSESVTGDLKLVVKHHGQQLPDSDGKLIVLINLSDESHGAPVEVLRPDVAVIFQPYYVLDGWDMPLHNPKVRPFPLGITTNFQAKPKAIKDRKYDAFFSGSIANTGSRHAFKMHVDNLVSKDKYNIVVNYTKTFNTGLSKNKYSEMLGNSKIAFCPAGAISRETFRFYESLQSGCIIINEALPRLWFYEHLTFFPTKWHSVEDAVDFAMSLGDEEMQKISDSNMYLYNTILSAKPIADYMLRELSGVLDCIKKGETLDINPELLGMANFKARKLGMKV